MPEGRPLSQDLGVFQGREERFSDSGEVAQPVMPQTTANHARFKTSRTVKGEKSRFMGKRTSK
jgi:hypothetical protein